MILADKSGNHELCKVAGEATGPKRNPGEWGCTGPVCTALQVSGGATQEKFEKFGADTSLGRPGQPAELASIYVQLAAADASYATGQVYGSSGGKGQP